jgi:hypothetical protein
LTAVITLCKEIQSRIAMKKNSWKTRFRHNRMICLLKSTVIVILSVAITLHTTFLFPGSNSWLQWIS